MTAAGLRLTSFVEPASYDPASYLTDVKLLERVAALPWIRRCAVAEGLSGALHKHIFYCVSAANRVEPPRAEDGSAIPIARDLDAAAFADSFRPGQALTARTDGVALRRVLPPLAGMLVRRIDSKTSVATIIDQVAQRTPEKPRDRIVAEWRAVFSASGLNGSRMSRGLSPAAASAAWILSPRQDF